METRLDIEIRTPKDIWNALNELKTIAENLRMQNYQSVSLPRICEVLESASGDLNTIADDMEWSHDQNFYQ